MKGDFSGLSFNSDNADLDVQHKKLLALCERAAELADDDTASSGEKFHILLNDLAIYARAYFSAEEERLRQSNPLLLAEHQEEYISYEQQLTDLLMAASRGVLDRIGLLQLLTAWRDSRVARPSVRYWSPK